MGADNGTQKRKGFSRRAFLQAAGAGMLSLGVGGEGFGQRSRISAGTAAQEGKELSGGTSSKPFNILFILTDQERYFEPTEFPPGYGLPGRERLQRQGVTFTNHQINSAVCTSSRSVI